VTGLKERRSSNVSDDPRTENESSRRVAELADELAPYHRRYEAARDSRAVFAFVYFNLTLDLAEWLADPDNAFDDPEWVADLAVAFGSRYRTAMDAIDEWQHDDASNADVETSLEGTVPRPWADVYRAICRDQSTVLEDLVFAIGAHITYDLPYALLDVGTETSRLADYHLMNEVLASRTDIIQDIVTNRYNRTVTKLDRVVGGADEVFTNYWLRIGRSMAWYNAMRMQSPRSRAEAEAAIERSTSSLIESVRNAGPVFVRTKIHLSGYILSLTRRWPGPPPAASDETVPRDARW